MNAMTALVKSNPWKLVPVVCLLCVYTYGSRGEGVHPSRHHSRWPRCTPSSGRCNARFHTGTDQEHKADSLRGQVIKQCRRERKNLILFLQCKIYIGFYKQMYFLVNIDPDSSRFHFLSSQASFLFIYISLWSQDLTCSFQLNFS